MNFSPTLTFIRLPSATFRFVFLSLSLLLLASCEGQKTIVNGLEEKDANEIIVFLSTKGIDAQKIKAADSQGAGGPKLQLWNIVVPSSQATEAMYLLNQQGLPKRRSQNLLGLYSTSGLISSDLQEKVKYRAALSEQIASTIRKIDGIQDADVQISFPEEDLLRPGHHKGVITASVWVKHSGSLDDLNSHLLTKIKRLVAASVTGLDYDNVTVIAEKGKMGEIPSAFTQRPVDADKEYVSIWGMIIGKESVTPFRAVFFSLCVIILALLFSIAWLLWKLLPLLENHGGIKELFKINPIPLTESKAPDYETKSMHERSADRLNHSHGLLDKEFDES